MPVLARWGVPLLLALAGLASGVAAVVLHQWWWGLLLGVATGLAATAAVPAGWGRRVPWAAGWLVAVGLATSRRAEGDYLVPGNVAGYTLLVAALVQAVAAIVTLPTPRRRGRAGGEGPGDPRNPVPRT